jgi:hydrogenase maturation protein HypF
MSGTLERTDRLPRTGRRRTRARVLGTVQGVGFRPYAFRLATELELGGWILNDERGVLLEVEGPPEAVDGFLARLPAEAPPLATVEAIDAEPVSPAGERGFRILESDRRGQPAALVAPDTATCGECLAELRDPTDRRYRYPFTNCTNCGPRLTIVTGVPYDRPLTTMAGFRMCAECRAEYENPRDRRFHAQPNACPACGPQVRLADGRGETLVGPDSDRDAVETAARMLRAGSILAIKGLGGYHLACVAADQRAVMMLRTRKHREDRPFALMTPDLAAARELVELDPSEEALLAGPARPIVIARRRGGAPVAAGVAPRSADLGVMLPYSPLHHLLLADTAATLVMTSGNVSDEPIAFGDDEALERLGGIADAFCVHDRPIHTRTDDSVVRAVAPAASTAPLLIRRSRGYVPESLTLPVPAEPSVLACGAELKNTFCLAKGARASVGHHIGDLHNYETLRSFTEGVAHFERLFAVEPAVVAHDLHPDYLSTRYALEREGVETVGVQHHHAHLAACLAEHGVTGDAVGAIYDGTGFGADRTVWGGEILAGGIAGYERAGLLFPVRLPGGDAAARQPWRMACAWLVAALEVDEPPIPRALGDSVTAGDWQAATRLCATGVNSPLTTSAGRLFDAVAAICGIRARVTYEGQAAAELEGITDPAERSAYPMPLIDARDGAEPGAGTIIDPRETVRALAADVAAGAEPAMAGARFHSALAGATAEACAREAERRGLTAAVLSGGVFQNRLLVERTAERLRRAGLRVLVPARLPPNDGGIAYGQAAIAAAGRS